MISAWFDKPFVLCVGNSLITSLLLWFGKLDASAYAAMVTITTGAYVGGWATKMIKGTPGERGDAAGPSNTTP